MTLKNTRTPRWKRENIHDSGDAPFSEEGLNRKRKAVMKEFLESSAARDKASVVGSERYFLVRERTS